MKTISTLEVQNIYDIVNQKIKSDTILDKKNNYFNDKNNNYLFNFLQKNIIKNKIQNKK